jgi:hypothetical protein
MIRWNLRILAAGFVLLSLGAYPQPVSHEQGRGITVTGAGVVSAKPTLARIGLGVQVLAPTVAQAVRESAARMEGLIQKLKSLGVPEGDILPSGYSVFPQRSFRGDRPNEISGYEVNNQIQATIRDLARLGMILDQAFQAGANNVSGIALSLDEQSALRSEARARAVADALAKADELARLGGARRGDLIAISELAVPVYPPFAALSSLHGLAGAASIPPAQIEIRVEVQVTCELVR